MARGTHLLIDCRGVDRDVCLNDGLVLDAMASGARQAGANVLSQVRYRFGHDSPPGFTAAIVLDESHCTAHSYAEHGLIAMDIFTCGSTSPYEVLRLIRERVDLGEVTVREESRFEDYPADAEDIPLDRMIDRVHVDVAHGPKVDRRVTLTP